MYKIIVTFLAISGCANLVSGQSFGYVNPTGSYTLNENINRNKLPVYSYYGDIQVLPLDSNKIVMTFFICKGAPSYNMGTFVDTLDYFNNMVEYRTIEDSSCSITYKFDKKGIKVNHEAENLTSSCGFGFSVIAAGYFKKKSKKIPLLINPATGELLLEK